MDVDIAPEDPRADDLRALLAAHLEFARHVTPQGHVRALDLDGLLDPAVTVFAARHEGRLVGVVALKRLDDGHAEIKSMHTAAAARGRGVGRAMVDHLVTTAAARGHTRVSLETGTYDAFAPARAMYARAGFVPCPPFAGYTDNPYSTCMTLVLSAPGGVEDRPGQS